MGYCQSFLIVLLITLIITSVLGAESQNNTAYSIGPDYVIKIDGKHNILADSQGTIILKVAQNDKSKDIIQAAHDIIASKKDDKGGMISIESGTYAIHKPMIFTVPIKLLMDKNAILKFDSQQKGDASILTTKAKATIQGGTFDCNKAVQDKQWIHGLVIDTGSKGSLIDNVEARNCSTYGNGIVMLADHSILMNSKSHDNDGDGVYLRSCDYCIVQHSFFTNNKINGIDASDQDGRLAGHTLIFNNTANGNLNGINLDTTYYANVTQNRLNGNWIGIAEYHSSSDNLHNSITNNMIKNSGQWGIYEQEHIPWHDPYISDYSTIKGNTMIKNGHDNVIKTESANSVVANNKFIN